MNKEELTAIKGMYDGIKKLIGDSTIYVILLRSFPELKDISPDKIFLLDSFHFMGYVASADGKITQREVNVMNYITGLYLTLEEVERLISNSGISTNIDTAPLSAKILCSIENLMYQNGLGLDDGSIMNTLIMYFQYLGNVVAGADSETTPAERAKIAKYISTIKEYAVENTLSPFFEY